MESGEPGRTHTETKVCSKCGEEKPRTEFNKRARSADGLRSECKACQRARKAAYRAANKEKVRARDAAYRSTPEGRARALIRTARFNAKRRGHPPPEITEKDILPAVERGVCQVTGLPFVWQSGGKQHPLAPSLDRPDASRPYTRDNWRIVCWAVNTGCSWWGLDTYLAIAARALGVQGPPLPSRYLRPLECSTGTGKVRPKSPVKEMQHDEGRVPED